MILWTWESRVFYSITVSTIQSKSAHVPAPDPKASPFEIRRMRPRNLYLKAVWSSGCCGKKKLCLSTEQPALLAFVLAWVNCFLKSYETDTSLVDGMQCTNIHQSVFWYLLPWSHFKEFTFTPGSVQGEAERCIWRLHEVKVCGWLAKWPQARPSCRGPQVK